jgi:prevent-host-death family protein
MTAVPQRIVNVHEAKTQFSRLIDAAHAGETIVVAKGGKPWARLVPMCCTVFCSTGNQELGRHLPGPCLCDFRIVAQ